MRKLVVAFLAIGAILCAKTYTLSLNQPTVVAGTELKPGDYKMDLKDSKVVVSNGKQSIETDVTVENNGSKYDSTTVRYVSADGKYKMQEIRLGGTNLRLVFNN